MRKIDILTLINLILCKFKNDDAVKLLLNIK